MWIFFSVLAVLCFSFVSIIDKYVLTKWVKRPIILVIAMSAFGLISAVVIYFIHGFSYLSFFNIFLALIGGTFTIFSAFFYFKALKKEEVSRVVPLFYLSTLFVSLFAAIFLKEVFTPLEYLGIFLLVFGAILISSRNPLKLGFSKALPLMLLSVTTVSANSLLTKYLLGFTDYWTVFSYMRIGGGILLIPISYIYLSSLILVAKKHGKRFIATVATSEILTVFAMLFFTIAASIGYITLVSAVSAIQPFFVLLLTVILSMLYPSIMKEEISKSVMIVKISAIIIMFSGVILLT